MSIVPKYVPTDVLYPVTTLLAVRGIKDWLEKKKTDEHPLNQLHRILEEMATEKPFNPVDEEVMDTSSTPPSFSQVDGFKYRKPVWQLIAEEIVAEDTTKSVTFKEKAEWLIELLELCRRYAYYEAALEIFRSAVTRLNFSFQTESLEFSEDVDVIVLGGLKERGEAARENVSAIIDALVLTIQEHVQKSSLQPAIPGDGFMGETG